MKIGILNRSDLNGGAAVSSLRLFLNLKEHEVNVEYLVGIKEGKNSSIMLHYKSDFFTKLRKYFEQLLLNKKNGNLPFSLGMIPYPINFFIRYHKIDIVHFNWVGGGFISIKSLSKIKKPIVWTMHDSWSFTGGCHIPYDCSNFVTNCGRCPQLNSVNKQDLSAYLYKIKKSTYNNINNITFVSPSKWLAEIASKSGLLSEKKIVVIPNGIDTFKFSPKIKDNARSFLNLKTKKKVVAFGAVQSTNDKNKGYIQLLSALDLLKELDFDVIVFGSNNIEIHEISGKKTYFLGRIWNEDLMSTIYSAADLTIVPSLSENLSNVIMESLSCGTPVVAFDIGGNADLIEHKLNGYLAKPYNIEDLAFGINYILFNSNLRQLQENSRKKIVDNFDINIISDMYHKLYKSVYYE
jgi:glycosyltransferase involved in cell wall biosynthesis